MTKCQKCRKYKKYVHVHTHRITKDGELKNYYWCRDCNTERQRKFRSTKHGRESTRKATARSIAKHWEKQKARITLNYYVRTGKIVRPKVCSSCKKSKKVEGHHEDYSRPLVVKWVCRQCHFMIK